MALTINNPTSNPFNFFFTEPASNVVVPDPKTFDLEVDFTTSHGGSSYDYSSSFQSLTSNFGNADRFGKNLATIDVTYDFTLKGNSGGIFDVSFDVPFEYYNRIGAGQTVIVKSRLTLTDNIDATSDTQDIWLNLTGANDNPTAHADVRAVTDNTTSFRDGTVLANDDDPDTVPVRDTLTITNAVLSGPVTGVPAFPPEYVAHPGAVSVSHDGTSVTFKPDPYFQFLGPGEKANFKILYTISDGHGGTSSAFLTVTINGLATQNFVGTKGDDNMLGENDTDNMDGLKGNDIIHARGGNDKVFGDKGNDILDGGTGGDQLFGEKGHDTFLYKTIADSTVSGTGRDKIKDFEHGDHIDLSALFGGVFAFIKSKAFHNVAGELRYEKSGHNIVVEGDTTGDGTADFAIRVDHLSKIGGGDFVL